MQAVAFPQCCTANVLIGMGASHTAGYDPQQATVEQPVEQPVEVQQ